MGKQEPPVSTMTGLEGEKSGSELLIINIYHPVGHFSRRKSPFSSRRTLQLSNGGSSKVYKFLYMYTNDVLMIIEW